MGIDTEIIDQRTQKKCESEYVLWIFMRNFIMKHPNDGRVIDVFALAIYRLIIFPEVLGHIEAAVIDFRFLE